MRNAIVVLAGLGLLAARAEGQAAPLELLNRAIARAGGREALSANPLLKWRAGATIHIPGRTIEIAGEWSVHPDSAVSSTWLRDQPNAPRRLILTGQGGWTQRGDAAPAVMSPELLVEERHQFYLYQVLRLVPLLDPAFTLSTEVTDSLGRTALRVAHANHPDVILYLDRDFRVAALHTVFAAPDMTSPESQQIELTGEVASQGIRWFKDMKILRAGKPYFDMTITEFRAEGPR
jgi:hypothetical protein